MSGISPPILIERECPDCDGAGWRDDLPSWVEDTRCNTCNGNKRIWIPADKATDDELASAIQAAWDACADATEEAQDHASQAQALEAEQNRRASEGEPRP